MFVVVYFMDLKKVKALFKDFGRTSAYFPTEKLIYKEARDI